MNFYQLTIHNRSVSTSLIEKPASRFHVARSETSAKEETQDENGSGGSADRWSLDAIVLGASCGEPFNHQWDLIHT